MAERLLAGLLVVPFLLGAAVAPTDQAQVAFSFRDNDIVESSGLAVVDGLVVTTNDSGDTGRVFTVDPGTGETVGVTEWADDPTDVEALAPDGRRRRLGRRHRRQHRVARLRAGRPRGHGVAPATASPTSTTSPIPTALTTPRR